MVRMPWTGCILRVVCLFSVVRGVLLQSNEMSFIKIKPPKIDSDFPKVIYFGSTRDRKTLDCTADGIPAPRYEWFKDGGKVITDSSTYTVVTGGRLELTHPSYPNIGAYQCFAINDYGKSMSTVVDIRRAELEPYPTLPIMSKTFTVGNHAILECRHQPRSSPKALVAWVTSKGEVIVTSNKIVQDQSGSLHFINVEKMNELQENETYKCSLYNAVANIPVFGSPTKLTVNELSGPIPPRGPTISYFTPAEESVAILGSVATIQCIPDGYPIPTIEWSKESGDLPLGGHDIFPDSYKLDIRNVTEGDEGNYICTAIQGSMRVSQRIFLDVKSEPIWVEKIRSVTVTNGKTATFDCIARSAKEETDNVIVKWFKNDSPLNSGMTDSITVTGTRLTVHNVRKPYDIANFQCKVSNSMGYQIADAFLNVIEETVLTVKPQEKISIDPGKAVEVLISAKVDPLYASRVLYTWRKDDVPVGSDPRQYVYVNQAHTLVINATSLGSVKELYQVLGDYSCHVSIGLEGGEGDVITYTKVLSGRELYVLSSSPHPNGALTLVLSAIFASAEIISVVMKNLLL